MYHIRKSQNCPQKVEQQWHCSQKNDVSVLMSSAGVVRASSIFPILSAILLLLGGVCVASSSFYKSKRNIILGGGILFVAAGKTTASLWFWLRRLSFHSEFGEKVSHGYFYQWEQMWVWILLKHKLGIFCLLYVLALIGNCVCFRWWLCPANQSYSILNLNCAVSHVDLSELSVLYKHNNISCDVWYADDFSRCACLLSV